MMYQYNDISVQKLRDSKIVQGEMLQQFEYIRLEQSVIKNLFAFSFNSSPPIPALMWRFCLCDDRSVEYCSGSRCLNGEH